MIPPRKQWTEFLNDADKLQYMIDNKLVSPKTAFPKQLTYSGVYVQEPTLCTLTGVMGNSTCVIRVGELLHCINVDYLAEMQSGFASSSAPEQYVVLDLETTGRSYREDCILEIAAIKYLHGIEQDAFETLVDPECPIPLSSTMVNGITSDDIRGAPVIAEILPALLLFLGDLPIVAHNAPFDRSFLQKAASSIGKSLTNKWIDTLPLARKAFPARTSYKLEDLKTDLRIPVDTSHRALPDVRATAALFEACNQALRQAQIDNTSDSNVELVSQEKTPRNSRISAKERHQIRLTNVKISNIQPTVGEIDSSSALFDKIVVFTGELSMDRREAMQRAVNAGAVLKSSVSRKTDYLVVGKQDKSQVGNDGMSGKERTARDLLASGQSHIRIIDELEFLRLLSST